MTTLRRALATTVVVTAALGLAGCTAGVEPELDGSVDATSGAEVAASGSAPIVFAFVCRTGQGDTTETYTTYAAAWEADRTDCTAKPITGTEMSAQQQAAVRAADDTVDLRDLAATCAERGVAPWTAAVETDDQARVAAGLLEYCPGHPERDRLQEALLAHRG
ncbi:hypothetical protein ACWGJ9_20285 [Curtobacterium citreum]